MRFLKFDDLGQPSLVERNRDDIPSYAILSHRWESEEVTYADLIEGTGRLKAGYDKVRFCAQRSHHDGLRFFWVDTCCINRANFTELSEAINSMFSYYQNAVCCYVYLSDVTTESAFPASEWFTRGWTLQELIAPSSVRFFSGKGEYLGTKISREQQISQVTRINIEAIRGRPLSEFAVAERFSWAQGRKTTLAEDAAYCLLGIFDIHMPLIYGEGEQKATERLKRKVLKSLHPAAGSHHPSWDHESSQALSHSSASQHFVNPWAQSPTDSVKIISPLPFPPGRKGPLQVLADHSGPVRAVGFSPDSKQLVSASNDGTIKVRKVGSNHWQDTLYGHESSNTSVAFSPGGGLLASASGDKVLLYDAHSMKAIHRFMGHSDAILAVSFSPNGKLLASASQDWNAILWDVQPGRLRHSLRRHLGPVNSVAFSPDGNYLASASKDMAIWIWSVQSNEAIAVLKGHKGSVNAARFSPNHRLLASASADRTIKLWRPDARSQEEFSLEETFTGHGDTVNDIAFSPDGNLLASASDDTTVMLRDIQSGAVKTIFRGHTDIVYAVAYSPDGKLLASASADGTVNLWEV
jgi:WD40 repeat protein